MAVAGYNTEPPLRTQTFADKHRLHPSAWLCAPVSLCTEAVSEELKTQRTVETEESPIRCEHRRRRRRKKAKVTALHRGCCSLTGKCGRRQAKTGSC